MKNKTNLMNVVDKTILGKRVPIGEMVKEDHGQV